MALKLDTELYSNEYEYEIISPTTLPSCVHPSCVPIPCVMKSNVLEKSVKQAFDNLYQ